MSEISAEATSLVESGAAPNAEYAQSMLDKKQTEPTVQTAAEATAIARPENIPEKFWDGQTGKVRTEDLLKSYGELEKKLREGKPADAEQKPEEKPGEATKVTLDEKKPEEKAGEPSEVAAVLAKAGISFDDVNAEYQKTGEVTANTRAKLDAAFGKPIVDNYFAGLRAQEATSLLAAHEAAGGKETFDKVMVWAREGLNDADLASYNAMVVDAKTQKQGIEWLVSKYQAANPSEGSFVKAEAQAGPGEVFNSSQEMTTAMRDPRYARDPAYRQQVAEKLNRSVKAGTISTGVSHHTQRI